MADVRLATAGDADALRSIYAPYVEDTPISFEYDPPTADEMGRRVEATVGDRPWLVCLVDGEVVGYAYAGQFSGRTAYRWTVEVSAYVRDDHRGRGVGRTLYESLFCVLPRQGFVDAYAGITLPNGASVGFHESMGFEPVGVYEHVGFKDGAWHDVGWWYRALDEYPDEPDPPSSLSELASSGRLADAIDAGLSSIRPTGDEP